MATVFELITMLSALALGFVLGRIWEIRQEIRRDQHVANRERRFDDGLAAAYPTRGLVATVTPNSFSYSVPPTIRSTCQCHRSSSIDLQVARSSGQNFPLRS